ncbi:Histidinol-phosphatase [Natranaerofaba carboxydovora]|nr:Histidinol-phosphatase [Natranaerofaba carboxydovora]
MDIRELIEEAKKKNIKEICITDHLEPDDLDGGSIESLKEYTKKYFEEIKEVSMKKDCPKIKIGVELGLSRSTLNASKEYIKAHSYDFVLASLHEVNGVEVNDWGFHKSISAEKAYKLYLEEMYYCLENYDNFDCLGHLDLMRRYIKRFKGKNDIIFTYELKPMIDDILRLIIDKGKGIELNTSGYRYGLLTPLPSFEVLERYKELGGEVITIGSDAHSEEEIGDKIQHAHELLLETGFEYFYTYEDRKAIANKLK